MILIIAYNNGYEYHVTCMMTRILSHESERVRVTVRVTSDERRRHGESETPEITVRFISVSDLSEDASESESIHFIGLLY